MLGTSTSSVTALLLLSLLKKLDKLSDRIEVEAMQWKDIVIERKYIFVYDERKKNALRSEADIAFLARKSKNAAKSVGFECSAALFPFGQQHVDKLRDRHLTFDFWLSTLVGEAVQRFNDSTNDKTFIFTFQDKIVNLCAKN